MHRVLHPDGVLTVMFTHKRVEAWDTLASALIGAGFDADNGGNSGGSTGDTVSGASMISLKSSVTKSSAGGVVEATRLCFPNARHRR